MEKEDRNRTSYQSDSSDNTAVGETPHDRIYHEQMVRGFRDYVDKFYDDQPPHIQKERPWSPDEIIRTKMHGQTGVWGKRHDFWEPILHAYDIHVFDRYPTNSNAEIGALIGLHMFAFETPAGTTPTVRLNSGQAKVFDALADALNIKHQKGLTEIPLPERFKNYEEWLRRHGGRDPQKEAAQAKTRRRR